MLRVDGFQAIRATRPDDNLTWQLIKKKIGFLFFLLFLIQTNYLLFKASECGTALKYLINYKKILDE